jgi:hypothetical protein
LKQELKFHPFCRLFLGREDNSFFSIYLVRNLLLSLSHMLREFMKIIGISSFSFVHDVNTTTILQFFSQLAYLTPVQNIHEYATIWITHSDWNLQYYQLDAEHIICRNTHGHSLLTQNFKQSNILWWQFSLLLCKLNVIHVSDYYCYFLLTGHWSSKVKSSQDIICSIHI